LSGDTGVAEAKDNIAITKERATERVNILTSSVWLERILLLEKIARTSSAFIELNLVVSCVFIHSRFKTLEVRPRLRYLDIFVTRLVHVKFFW